MKNSLILTCLVLIFGGTTTTYAVMIDFADIGNAGNAPDTHGAGYGAVSYNYAISKTEVTNAQYVEFLNSIAATDSYDLYDTNMGNSVPGGIARTGSPGSYTYAVKADAVGMGPGGADYTYADKPVVYVSWYDSVRFTNWLHNGQGTGDTETGAYSLLGGTATPTNGLSVTREAAALYWLPSQDEWYKAAYHDASSGTAGTYFDYATGTDIDPDNNLPSADTGNSANYRLGGVYTHNPNYATTDVGAYGLSESSYGTYDQSGNVNEWNETNPNAFSRVIRGGGWGSFDAFDVGAQRRGGVDPAFGGIAVGFRVATVTEPSVILGDYDFDGDVDGADYLKWQRSFGSTTDLDADGNGNNIVDAADYTIWRDNYGSLKVDLSEARNLAIGTPVFVEGVVTNSVDLVNHSGLRNFHVQDETGAITVFGDHSAIDALLAGVDEGDRISLSGTLGTFNGLFQLLEDADTSLELANYGFEGVIEPTEVTTSDFLDFSSTAESLESSLVTLSGVSFIETGDFQGSTNYTVTDGTSNVSVRISTADQGIVGLAIPTGTIDLVGIFNQYDPSQPNPGVAGSGYQLLLRRGSDIVSSVGFANIPEPSSASILLILAVLLSGFSRRTLQTTYSRSV